MRRKIALYIADQLVDLDDQTFILFNYTMEDMSNPAIVRNSFSQSVTIKGTPNNNKIFGGIWRSDRETIGGGTTGAYFDPTKKTSFTIYNELNEILESGYCKLDGISRKGVNVEYKVSLFGGLGAFFYALSYDEKGNKRTLADLKFNGENAQETELDFRITKESVLGAWKRLNGDKSQSSLWDIINFAPAYNGLPSGQFDAGKAIINAANAGLSVPDGYMTTGGFVVATLPMEYTEWETKDLRSYLQRPVIKMKSIIDSICKAYNNGGYEVELDDEFFSSANPYYNDTYLTLPIINTLSIASEKHEEDLMFDLTFDNTINLPAETGGNPSTEYILKIRIKPRLSLDEYSDYDLYMHCTQSLIQNGEEYRITRTNYITYTAIAYDAEGVELKREKVSVGTNENQSASFNYLGFFTPDGEWAGDDVEFNFQGYGISYIRILQEIDSFWSSIGGADIVEPTPTPMLVWGQAKWENSIGVKEYAKEASDSTYTYITSEIARSGATITKSNLLSSDKTPADYLLSFCKMFGLVFKYDKGMRKVSILQKRNFYHDNIIDLTDRINLGVGVQITPYVFDSKWYDWGVKYENGEYASYYSNVYDREFGLQRVNTGYGFNADSKDVLDSVRFRGAVETLEKSKHFVDIKSQSIYFPSVFQDAGGTYVLKRAGENEEFNLPTIPLTATKKWINVDFKTCDAFSKVQFHDAGNKSYEERDTLLFFRGIKHLTGITDRYAVTDDSTRMLSLNDGTPCWLLDYQLVDPTCAVSFLPMFSRYKWDYYNSNVVTKSLDFGTPAEIDIPDAIFHVDSSIYTQYWSRYIKDRYDDDSKVMVCSVNLSGMQVDESLFQSFYYYDGALWALNKIINHSLTTWDDTECEFIKVQDKSNYQN